MLGPNVLCKSFVTVLSMVKHAVVSIENHARARRVIIFGGKFLPGAGLVAGTAQFPHFWLSGTAKVKMPPTKEEFQAIANMVLNISA